MFVIRLLLAALATILIALLLGSAMGYSVWQSAGFALLAVLVLQVLILAYVIRAAMRKTRILPQKPLKQALRKQPDQLSVLPE